MRFVLALILTVASAPAFATDNIPPGPDFRVIGPGEVPESIKAYRAKMAAEAESLRTRQKAQDLKARKAMSGICKGC